MDSNLCQIVCSIAVDESLEGIPRRMFLSSDLTVGRWTYNLLVAVVDGPVVARWTDSPRHDECQCFQFMLSYEGSSYVEVRPGDTCISSSAITLVDDHGTVSGTEMQGGKDGSSTAPYTGGDDHLTQLAPYM